MRIFAPEDLIMLQWHIVLCRPNQFHIAERSLSRLGHEVFMPKLPFRRRGRTRTFEEFRPAFPSYLFVGLDPNRPRWHPIRSATGVARIVGFGERGPAKVPAELIAGLMARCNGDGILQPIDESFSIGEKVKIIAGPFTNFVSQIEAIDPEKRIHVLLDLLGRPTRVSVEAAQVARLSSGRSDAALRTEVSEGRQERTLVMPAQQRVKNDGSS